jgi:S-formylglutathione hydrolase FrmB
VRGIFGSDIQNWRAHDPVSLVQAMPKDQLALYVDCGTEDEFALENQAQYLHDVLLDRGIEHVYYLGPGKHDMQFWSVRVADSLAFFQSKLAPAQ